MIRANEPAERRDETRTRILTATREIYAEKGSRGTTTREVAERAGVNEATLFRHFGTKGQLLAAMLDHFAGPVDMEPVYSQLSALPSTKAQLELIALTAVEHLKQKEDLIKVAMSEELTNPDAVKCAWRAPTEARSVLRDFMREKVEAGALRGEPEFLARAFLSLCFSYVMARRLWSDANLPRSEAVNGLIDIFLNGAVAH